eukprot:360671-Chlamydomonas_euryale.AAC.5
MAGGGDGGGGSARHGLRGARWKARPARARGAAGPTRICFHFSGADLAVKATARACAGLQAAKGPLPWRDKIVTRSKLFMSGQHSCGHRSANA